MYTNFGFVLPPLQTTFTRRTREHCLKTFIAVDLALFPLSSVVSHTTHPHFLFSLSRSIIGYRFNKISYQRGDDSSRIIGRCRCLSSEHLIRTDFGATQSPIQQPPGKRVSFSHRVNGRGMELTTHSNLVLRLQCL
jgi:hypothetical protein